MEPMEQGKHNTRSRYLYITSFAGLMLICIAAILSLRIFWASTFFPPAIRHCRTINTTEGKSDALTTRCTEEKQELGAWALSLFLVGAPLFGYHLRKAQKDAQNS